MAKSPGAGSLHPPILPIFRRTLLDALVCMHHSTAPGTASFSLEALELCLPREWGGIEQQPSYLNRVTLDSGQEWWQCVPRGFPGAVGINANICPGPDLLFPFLLDLLMGNEPLEMRKGEGVYCQRCEFLNSEPEYESLLNCEQGLRFILIQAFSLLKFYSFHHC